MIEISKLEHSDSGMSELIYSVFQRSYQIEADLIGSEHFPPLARTAMNIQETNRSFFGLWSSKRLAGVIEVEMSDLTLCICSLVVDPDFFRQGVASQLIEFVVKTFDYKEAFVETAVANIPAIELYQKHGFTEVKRWTPEHGIKKIQLKVLKKSG